MRHLDAQTGRIVKIAPGELYVTSDPTERIATVLGSCVAACIRDPAAGVGGLNHYMLPESHNGQWGGESQSLRYGNYAMDRLIEELAVRGGRIDRMEVKLFGAACSKNDPTSVGALNARFAQAYLKARGIMAVVSQLGGAHARHIIYAPVMGLVQMKELHDPSLA